MSQQLPPDFDPWETEETPVPPLPARHRRRIRPGVKAAIGTMLVLILAVALVYDQLLSIHNIQIVGNNHLSRQEVITSAGLDKRTSYFALNEEQIAENINSNRYLIFETMEKTFPDSVTLYVSERTACATIHTSAAAYVLSADGMVLDRTADGSIDNTKVLVTGFQPRDVRVGSMLVPSSASKMEAYKAVMEELILQGCISEISELDLSNPENLYLTTMDRYTVHLGNREEMRAKIGTVRAVTAKLREMGKTGGLIEASEPAMAVYTPENL